MAMKISYVTLTQGNPQEFYITLNNIQYYLVITWCNCKKNPHYNLSIYYDSNKNRPVACGIPLVCNWGLTNQLRYLGFNFGLVVSNPSLKGEMKYGDLGTSHFMYIGVEVPDETVS